MFRYLCLCLVLLLAAGVILTGCSGDSKESRRTSPDKVSATGEEAKSKPYLASTQVAPFHKSTCGQVKDISTEHLVGFDSREAAIGSGHRPCNVCKP
jgi:methylphosphotriester-DNA--protein-cysteine methyltransferase